MNVPSTDFMALMYIVSPPLHRQEPVSSLKRAANSLEKAKFVDFWEVGCRQQRRKPRGLLAPCMSPRDPVVSVDSIGCRRLLQ